MKLSTNHPASLAPLHDGETVPAAEAVVVSGQGKNRSSTPPPIADGAPRHTEAGSSSSNSGRMGHQQGKPLEGPDYGEDEGGRGGGQRVPAVLRGDSWETIFHRIIRGVCIFLITSTLAFALLNEVKPKSDSAVVTLPPAVGVVQGPDPHSAVGDSPPLDTATPQIQQQQQPTSTRAQPPAQTPIPSPTIPTDPLLGIPSSAEGKACARTRASWIPSSTSSSSTKSTIVPKGELPDGVTTPLDIQPQRKLSSLLSCLNIITSLTSPAAAGGGTVARCPDAGPDGVSVGEPYRYQFLFIPIGCFGDRVLHDPCDLISCKLGNALAIVADNSTTPAKNGKDGQPLKRGCAHDKFGAFLGDNFYPNGIRRATDLRFEAELKVKFWHHSSLQFPYYSTLGNHDNPKPYAQFRSDHPYWKLPGFHHYSPMLVGKDGKTTVQIFLFSTHWGFAKNDPNMAGEAQWLDEALSKSTARWKIVASHEPIWGFMNFPHGTGLVKHIHPVLLKHKVQLYVTAHAHSVSIHRCPGGYYQLISAGFSSDNIHDMVKPNRPQGRFHLGTGATSVLIDYDRIDIVAFTSEFSMLWDAQIDYDEVMEKLNMRTTGGGGSGSGSGNGAATLPGSWWLPPHSTSTSKEGHLDYWTVRSQCEAFLPKIPPYCRTGGK